jgi:hypothetical protein
VNGFRKWLLTPAEGALSVNKENVPVSVASVNIMHHRMGNAVPVSKHSEVNSRKYTAASFRAI